MKKIKLIPFYLLSIINFLASVVVATDYPSTMSYDMHFPLSAKALFYNRQFLDCRLFFLLTLCSLSIRNKMHLCHHNFIAIKN